MERGREEGAAPLGIARLALAQGTYYAVTGLWPILHLRSFEAVTGPKLEGWLVKTVGALAAVISGTLLSAGLRRHFSRELALLALGSAAAFTAVDLVYVSRRRISPVYLLDAMAEVALLAGWGTMASRLRTSQERSASPSLTESVLAGRATPASDASHLERPKP